MLNEKIRYQVMFLNSDVLTSLHHHFPDNEIIKNEINSRENNPVFRVRHSFISDTLLLELIKLYPQSDYLIDLCNQRKETYQSYKPYNFYMGWVLFCSPVLINYIVHINPTLMLALTFIGYFKIIRNIDLHLGRKDFI